jgi:thymidylate synthase (FAD)
MNKNRFILLTFISIKLMACDHIDPLNDGMSSIRLIDHCGSDLSIANAARVSYGRHNDSESKGDASLLSFLIEKKHETPFEQTFLQFHVKAPIFVIRQWMRHRIGVSYNEKSARYTVMKHEFYTPQCDPSLQESYKLVYEQCSKVYDLLLSNSLPREQARCVLPISTYSEFVFSCNLRSLFHFIELRAAPEAQWEIRQYAKALLTLSEPCYPISIKLWIDKNKIV